MHSGKILLKRETKNYNAGFCILNCTIPDIFKNVPLLHPEEKAYFDTLQFDRRRESYLQGRIAAKKAVNVLFPHADLSSILIDQGIFQFPVVKTAATHNIQVSITHCDAIGIGIAFPEEHPLGIDVEKIDDSKTLAIKSQASDKELSLLPGGGLSITNGCALLWTVKESLSKILRTGLMINFHSLEIQTLEREGVLYISTFSNFAQYKAITYLTATHACSLVLPRKTTVELNAFLDVLSGVI
ncbi:MAG TPA: 4'-phosphopantetheinyl transferase superfamily protein [Chitinophaga sp.]|uniref:4'-phosphopantetheinyl transferase superfamily protein n=1 Tax=Chitinophaga sp. TaxID=1869181 RepID=UPI002C0881AA|nr:4'-phosphopantetheinyl transferase superfamily protein [Chitinophaga sp.]HVI45329.1 4'-phosphopantetheinyl transferase superfamily protein [Chitinophaga sp.]